LSQFLDKLRVQESDGPWWKLTDRLRYQSSYLGETICVPNGFVTDFASVPRVPVLYWLWGSRADRPSVIHDYLYRMAEVSRSDADYVFYESMRADGCATWKAYPMYVGVWAGGWASYGNNQGKLDPR